MKSGHVLGLPLLLALAVCGFTSLMIIGYGAATDFTDCDTLNRLQFKYTEAIECYDKVISENSSPMVAYALYQKSYLLYTHVRDLDGALEAIDKAAKLDPQYAQFRFMYEPTEKTREFARAHASDLNNTIDLDRNNVTALIDKGSELFELGMYDEALQYYNDAIALDPKNIKARSGKALVFASERQETNLTKTYDEIAELGVKDTQIWEYTATVDLDYLQLYEEAIRCLDRAIKINDEYIQQNPNNATAWNNKGVELFLQADEDRAGYAGLELYSDEGSISRNRAHTKYRQEKWAEALECFEKSTQLDPNCAEAWYNRGLALFAQSIGGESIDFYKEVVHCSDQARHLPSKDGYSMLVDTRGVEYTARIKLDELNITSRDVARVAKYA